ncbi:MFS general substrate transporter [Thozetella sp. PMI_491]|nr:MFS general substrate transporter [Thozetella sp. PMI_491]
MEEPKQDVEAIEVQQRDDNPKHDAIVPPTAEEEARVIRKLDWHLMPLIFIIYMLSVLDRSNLSNAYVAGMDKSIDLSGNKYNWLGTAFYISYILSQWTAVGWKQFPPHIWVTCVVLTWVTISSLQSAVQNYAGEVALRVLLGASEAMYAGVPLYLSFFYPRDRLGFRQAIFASAGSMANAYGGALGYAILGIKSSIDSWRVLFLIEGLPGLIVVVVAFFLLPDEISTARFLTPRDKEIAIDMVKRGQIADVENHQGTRWKQWANAFTDWRSYPTGIMYFVTNVCFSGLGLFTPTIIAGLGTFNKQQSNGLSAPPYLFTFILTLTVAWISDRVRMRGPFIVLFATTASIGFLLLAVTEGAAPRYVGVFLAITSFIDIAILLPWMSNLHATESKRAGGWAIFATLGQLGPLVGTNIFTTDQAPYYKKGAWVAFGLCLLLAATGAAFSLSLHLENKKLDRTFNEEGDEDEGGNGQRGFRYVI